MGASGWSVLKRFVMSVMRILPLEALSAVYFSL
jgi:hypothetical protein